MTRKRAIAIMVGGIVLALAGVAAVAANLTSSHQTDFFASGKHQFYVWCVGGRDFVAYEDGASAEVAQMSLYNREKADGKSRCWPIWQGRVSG